ncbi:secondary thiamine-phosphate synthase enzyme YjbQ [Nitrosophilus labii]|uniref:secondary thiamine-phosphate synthase enzyme YjbQ n=1 Tax=Nitrosophilus labii TaxID=2706014 RepID=UPI001656F1AC|nr:secondary thiamine-phosphate synthase enzyme YjbQ [Nitrosophilus labii]
MKIFQKEIVLKTYPRGFYLVTEEILSKLKELNEFEKGLCHLFLLHTSASLTINENADPSVRRDFLSFTNKIVPENEPYYTHILEGSDDMPAHIKSSLYGNSLTIPVKNGTFVLGIWQGIYLCEHRDFPSNRHIFATIIGE